MHFRECDAVSFSLHNTAESFRLQNALLRWVCSGYPGGSLKNLKTFFTGSGACTGSVQLKSLRINILKRAWHFSKCDAFLFSVKPVPDPAKGRKQSFSFWN